MASNIMLTLAFLAVVVVVYYLLPQYMRVGILLLASLIFYMSASPWMVLLVVGSALWSWFAGKKIEETSSIQGKRGWLLGCILPLLGVLFWFKYLNFFLDSVVSVLQFLGIPAEPRVLRLILPMGISYYTFKIISYAVDIYRGKRGTESRVDYYLTYVLFFSRRFCRGP